MTVFFTSDHHFGHDNIIKFCNRPFADVREMNDTLIKKWNEKVDVGDTVYIIGDFALEPFTDAMSHIGRLKGKKHFINGSHDRWLKDPRIPKDSSHFTVHKNMIVEVREAGEVIILCHYSMRSWPRSHHGTWHLFGHHHNNLGPHGKSFDIGVDCHDFYPLSFDEVKAKMDTLNSFDDRRDRV